MAEISALKNPSLKCMYVMARTSTMTMIDITAMGERSG